MYSPLYNITTTAANGSLSPDSDYLLRICYKLKEEWANTGFPPSVQREGQAMYGACLHLLGSTKTIPQ